MKITDIARRSGRNLRQAKARTLLTALAIGVGAFALTLTLAASNGAKSFVNGIINDNFDPAELIVAKNQETFDGADTTKPKEYNQNFSTGFSQAGALIQVEKLNLDDVTKLEAIEGVENVRLDLSVNLKYITRPGQKQYVATMTVINPFRKLDLAAGMEPKQLGSHELILPEAWLDSLGFKNAEEAVGKQLTLVAQKSFNPADLVAEIQQGKDINQLIADSQNSNEIEETFTIVAVMRKPTAAQQPGTQLYLLANEQDVQRLQASGNAGTLDFQKYDTVYVRAKNGQDKVVRDQVQARIKQAGYAAVSVEEAQKQLNQLINVLQGIVAAFSLIAVVASLFGVINTMYISVLQRTREIGLMKALGMRRRDISRLFRYEAAWIGFIGGAIGAISAYLLGLALNPWITKQLELGVGKKLLEFRIEQIVGMVIGLVLVAVVASLFPARKAAKLDPIEALRTE